jgi:hypothetical protein
MRVARWGFLAVLLLTGSAALLRAAEPHLTRTSGTIVGFDPESSLLTVNTRLGQKAFLVTNQTLFLLNNHGATRQDVGAGDEADIAYWFDTLEARRVHIHREVKQRGRVRDIAAGDVAFVVKRNTEITLESNDQTRFFIEGIRLEDEDALIGLQADAVYEPDNASPLLLTLDGDTDEFSGRVTAVDEGAGTFTVQNSARTRTFELSPAGTIRLDGVFSDLGDLTVGRKVFVAFVRDGTDLLALAVRNR